MRRARGFGIPVAMIAILAGCAATGGYRQSGPDSATLRPLYYHRAIEIADLEGRSLRELSLLRNTIFARAGQPFRREWLRRHFESQPWYGAGATLDTARLTAFDQANAATVGRYELSLTRADLLARRQSIMARGAPTSDDRIERALIEERLGEWESDPARGRPSPLQNPALLDSLLTIRQLDDFSRRDLWLLRHLIEGRLGRPFASESLRLHFSRFEWYVPDASFTDARLSPTDRRNIRLILSLEEEIGGPLSEVEADRWYSAA